MREIKISDEAEREENIEYIRSCLLGTIADFKGEVRAETVGQRTAMTLKAGREYYEYLKYEVEDKVAEVIAIKYKYEYFKAYIKAGGLSELETEMLFNALIAADLEEDKGYISRKLRRFSEYAIDGVYNFRLGALKKKWADIVGYIPTYFERGRLADFISYLTAEKRGKTVTIENGVVYDRHYNILSRTQLLGDFKEGRIVREAILSSCGEVRLIGVLPETDKEYLKLFFPERITFLS